MNFELGSIKLLKPEALYLLALVLPSVFLLFKSKTKFLSACARLLTICLLILALCNPISEEKTEKEEIGILFDVSKSIDITAKLAFLEMIDEYRKDSSTKYKVYLFGKKLGRSFKLDNLKELRSLILENKEEELGLSTNLEQSFRELSLSEADSSFILATDGNQTEGLVSKILPELADKKIRLFPVVPEKKFFEKEKLFISFIDAPLLIRAKSKVPILISLKNEFEQSKNAELKVLLDNKSIESKNLKIKGNSESSALINTEELLGGLHELRAQLLEAGSVVDERIFFLSVQEPKKVLLVSGNKEDSKQLREVFEKLGLSYQEFVDAELKDLPKDLSAYRSVIFNNAAKKSLRKGFLEELEQYVAEGGGLLILGGDKSFGLGGYLNTALEKISPLSFVEPQKKQRPLKKALLMLIDKSKSMSKDDRMYAAKKAAFVAISSMKDEDYVGVIGFDTAPFEVLKLDTAGKVKKIAEDLLNNRLTPIGGTSLLDSLSLAKRRLRAVDAGVKHIIVLGDGEFQDGSSTLYFEEIEAARRAGITISTVVIGGEADVPFMRRMAQAGGGSFYETGGASRLPEIFLQDIKISSGELTLKEQTDFPVLISENGMRTTSVQGYPDLRGFVESKIKQGADLELNTQSNNAFFPLLASWKYEKGSVIAFSSDLNGRWSSRWMGWPNYQVFVGDLLDKLKTSSAEGEKEISYDFRYKLAQENLEFELSLFDQLASDQIEASVETPEKKKQNLNFKKLAPGRFRAELSGVSAGNYFVDIKLGKTELPKLGLHLAAELFGEAPGKGLNVSLLSEIAKTSSGEINPSPADFSGSKSYRYSRDYLFAHLLILAFFLIILEAFLREGAFRNMLRRSIKR